MREKEIQRDNRASMGHTRIQDFDNEVGKCIYSSISNKNIMGMLFLDMAKALNCVYYVYLYEHS